MREIAEFTQHFKNNSPTNKIFACILKKNESEDITISITFTILVSRVSLLCCNLIIFLRYCKF